jgi:5-methylcytosine-specific restriction endonuclease McrA
MVWLVSLEALQRGHIEGDEVCEIPGVGPVPVSAARDALGEANLHLVITRGKDVASYCHLGEISPSQRAAVFARAGGRCERPGCANTTHLQIDHIWERQYGGPTRVDNLRLLCGADHRMKTNENWRLIGPPGRGRWIHLNQLPGDPARGYPMAKLKHLLPSEAGEVKAA